MGNLPPTSFLRSYPTIVKTFERELLKGHFFDQFTTSYFKGGFIDRTVLEEGGFHILKYVEDVIYPPNIINELQPVEINDLRTDFSKYKHHHRIPEYSLLDTFNKVKESNRKLPENPSNVFVLCFDGTGMGEHNIIKSNIYKIANYFPEDDNVLYIHGCGAESILIDPLKILFGDDVETILFKMYRSLFERTGGKGEHVVYVFGFSRGAFSAVSFVNLLCKCGIPRNEKEYEVFTKAYKEGLECKGNDNVEVKFVGLFDCVSTVLKGNKYHKICLENVHNFYHAMAANETNSFFVPTIPYPKNNNEGVHYSDYFIGGHADIGGFDLEFPKKELYSNVLSNTTLVQMLKHAVSAELKFDEKILDNIKMKEFDHKKTIYVHDVNYFLDAILGSIWRLLIKEFNLKIMRKEYFNYKDMLHLRDIHDSVFTIIDNVENKEVEVLQYFKNFIKESSKSEKL